MGNGIEVMKLTIVMDAPQGWYYRYGKDLGRQLAGKHQIVFAHCPETVETGDCALFLNCQAIIRPELLARNRRNIVVHASALPKGRGWSPAIWRILEGSNEITLTLFEAVERVDAGPIYLQKTIYLDGHELLGQIRERLGTAINELVMDFVKDFSSIVPSPQIGDATYYRKRLPEDSELDPNKTIAEQFNLLRVVDNEKYPAFFRWCGHTYTLKIEELS